MSPAEKVIRNEIAARERELDALKKALVALGGTTARRGTGKGNQKPKTAAQKRAPSAAL